MESLRLLCLLVTLFFVAEQVVGQVEKMLAEWSASVANKYPKPLDNDVKCRVNVNPMRICDPNEVLSDDRARIAANHLLQQFEISTFQKIANCHQPGVFVVALLKSISGEAHDKGRETVGIAEQFHQLWSLNNCSAVFVVSGNDKTCGLILGDALKQLLPGFNTTSISSPTSPSPCFAENRFQSNLEPLMLCLRNAFREEIGKIPEPRTEETQAITTISYDTSTKSESKSNTALVVGCVIGALIGVGAIAVVTVMIIKRKRPGAQKYSS